MSSQESPLPPTSSYPTSLALLRYAYLDGPLLLLRGPSITRPIGKLISTGLTRLVQPLALFFALFYFFSLAAFPLLGRLVFANVRSCFFPFGLFLQLRSVLAGSTFRSLTTMMPLSDFSTPFFSLFFFVAVGRQSFSFPPTFFPSFMLCLTFPSPPNYLQEEVRPLVPPITCETWISLSSSSWSAREGPAARSPAQFFAILCLPLWFRRLPFSSVCPSRSNLSFSPMTSCRRAPSSPEFSFF